MTVCNSDNMLITTFLIMRIFAGYRVTCGIKGFELAVHSFYFAGLMPSLLGPQFEEGLTRLKMVSERADSLETEGPES